MNTNDKSSSKTDADKETEFLNGTFGIVLIVWIFAFCVVAFYVIRFKTNNISLNPAEWGAFGDYVGGLVNPVVGIATVILVFLTLAVQRKELKASLTELKVANESTAKLSFEQSLFAWLSNYHSLIGAIEIPNKVSGRKALNFWYLQDLAPDTIVLSDNINDVYSGRITKYESAEQTLARMNTPNEGIRQIAPFLQQAIANYQIIYRDNRTDLDAPFRTLFRLIRWIDESELTMSQKWHYVALVRAQLSWVEQVFLFYNCLTVQGKKMSAYANKYALFDNLVGGDGIISFAAIDFTNCPDEKRPKNLHGLQNWPYLSAAFSSKIAKQALLIPENT